MAVYPRTGGTDLAVFRLIPEDLMAVYPRTGGTDLAVFLLIPED